MHEIGEYNNVEKFYHHLEIPIDFDDFDEFQNYDFYDSKEDDRHLTWKTMII